jgi:hypothetical protein
MAVQPTASSRGRLRKRARSTWRSSTHCVPAATEWGMARCNKQPALLHQRLRLHRWSTWGVAQLLRQQTACFFHAMDQCSHHPWAPVISWKVTQHSWQRGQLRPSQGREPPFDSCLRTIEACSWEPVMKERDPSARGCLTRACQGADCTDFDNVGMETRAHGALDHLQGGVACWVAFQRFVEVSKRGCQLVNTLRRKRAGGTPSKALDGGTTAPFPFGSWPAAAWHMPRCVPHPERRSTLVRYRPVGPAALHARPGAAAAPVAARRRRGAPPGEREPEGGRRRYTICSLKKR